MTYPPPGGENPQYQLQPEPQQPSDPYMQGYGSTPPPGNYYQQPPQYSQPPGPPMMPPQINVQQGYPTGPGPVLPPPIPPSNSNGNLGIILGVIVAIVVVLGVAAVLIIPGLSDDEGEPEAGGGEPTASEEVSEEASEEPTAEASEEGEAEPSEEADAALEGWGTAVSSEDYDINTPEGAAIAYRLGADTDDNELLQSVVCASPTSSMQNDVDWEVENTGLATGYIHWGIARENSDGTIDAWAGWTFDDLAPDTVDDLSLGYTFTAVEEDGKWKLCDVAFGGPAD